MDKLTINDNDLLGWKDDKQILLDIKEGKYIITTINIIKNKYQKKFYLLIP